MRGGVTAALVFAPLLVVAPAAGGVGAEGMKVAASPATAGAHRVHLALTFSYEMQCNYPGAGPLVVTFPSAMRLPKRFAAGSVKLAGKTIAAKRKGHHVTVTVPPPDGALCGMVGPGTVKLVFTRRAKLGNPEQPGYYRVRATHTRHTFTARLAIQ
jgi:hypothetical protein